MDIEAQVDRIRELQRTRLRRYREAAGLTQREVADRLGVSQPAVAKWEERNDPGEWWPRLARLYGMNEQYPSAPFGLSVPGEAGRDGRPGVARVVGERERWFDGRNARIQVRGSMDAGQKPRAA